jgi:hypothetical protein
MPANFENDGRALHVHYTNAAEIITPCRNVQIFYTTDAAPTFDFVFSH